MSKKNVKYTEPTDYFPKEVRKKLKIGEFAENKEENKKVTNEEFRNYVNGK